MAGAGRPGDPPDRENRATPRQFGGSNAIAATPMAAAMARLTHQGERSSTAKIEFLAICSFKAGLREGLGCGPQVYGLRPYGHGPRNGEQNTGPLARPTRRVLRSFEASGRMGEGYLSFLSSPFAAAMASGSSSSA